MTVQDLIQVCDDEGLGRDTRIVIGFVGGATFDLTTVDGNEAGDNVTIFVTPTKEVL